MKHLLFFTLVFVAIHNGAQAQDWSLAGNSNASATTSKLGTTNAIPLRLFTSNLERMRIDAAGNIGVNAISPKAKFHVNGFGAFGNRVSVANAIRALNLVDTAAVMRILRVDATNAPAVELISRTSADGANVAYWDLYAHPGDKSFHIRDRVGGGSGINRLTISNNGSVGIGTTTPTEKLHVVGNGYFTGKLGLNQIPSYPLDIYNTAYQNGINAVNFYNTEEDRVGVYASSFSSASSDIYFGIGVDANAGYIGVRAGGTTYGVYSSGYYGVYGIGFYAGYFEGDVVVEGSIFTASDRKFKTGITPLKNSLEQLMKLKPSAYEFKTTEYVKMGLPTGKQIGMIADEIKQVFPELVKQGKHPAQYGEDKKTIVRPEIKYEGVNYQGFIPVLIASVQEQQQQIEKQKQQIEDQQKQIDDLKQMVNKLAQGKTQNTSISNSTLGQNTPNPVKSTTSISYSVPEEAARVQLLITDAQGRSVRQMNLNTSGIVKIDVSSLLSGVYNYSLIVNNNTVVTRKMTVVK